uniref:Uncharacterized protein n=1 Tax=Sphaerodactylus townsendi TaxID=933632 RepID=A0ACB8FES0_9SAUR
MTSRRRGARMVTSPLRPGAQPRNTGSREGGALRQELASSHPSGSSHAASWRRREEGRTAAGRTSRLARHASEGQEAGPTSTAPDGESSSPSLWGISQRPSRLAYRRRRYAAINDEEFRGALYSEKCWDNAAKHQNVASTNAAKNQSTAVRKRRNIKGEAAELACWDFNEGKCQRTQSQPTKPAESTRCLKVSVERSC